MTVRYHIIYRGATLIVPLSNLSFSLISPECPDEAKRGKSGGFWTGLSMKHSSSICLLETPDENFSHDFWPILVLWKFFCNQLLANSYQSNMALFYGIPMEFLRNSQHVYLTFKFPSFSAKLGPKLNAALCFSMMKSSASAVLPLPVFFQRRKLENFTLNFEII